MDVAKAGPRRAPSGHRSRAERGIAGLGRRCASRVRARVWRGPSSRTRTPSRVRARPGRVAGWCVPSHSPLGLVPDRPWARVARRRKAGGEEEEDARRTFEAGPERPLGVIDDGLPRLAVLHPVRPWRARAFGPCARLLRLAPQDAPQELRSPRSLRGKQRKPCVAPSEPPSYMAASHRCHVAGGQPPWATIAAAMVHGLCRAPRGR